MSITHDLLSWEYALTGYEENIISYLTLNSDVTPRTCPDVLHSFIHTLVYPFKNCTFALCYPKIGPQYAIKRNGRAIEQQTIHFVYFILEILIILVERKSAP